MEGLKEGLKDGRMKGWGEGWKDVRMAFQLLGWRGARVMTCVVSHMFEMIYLCCRSSYSERSAQKPYNSTNNRRLKPGLGAFYIVLARPRWKEHTVLRS